MNAMNMIVQNYDVTCSHAYKNYYQNPITRFVFLVIINCFVVCNMFGCSHISIGHYLLENQFYWAKWVPNIFPL